MPQRPPLANTRAEPEPAPVRKGRPPEHLAEPRRHLGRPCPVRLLIGQSFEGYPAWLRDVSSGGIGLLTEEPFEVGAILAVRLPDRRAGCSGVLTAKVRHATPLPDGVWLVGCSLARPLTPNELLALL